MSILDDPIAVLIACSENHRYVDDPIAVLIACSENHRYVMVLDLRDFSAVYYRSGLESKTRGVQTNQDSLPVDVMDYFFHQGWGNVLGVQP